jgi:hypothetical protein
LILEEEDIIAPRFDDGRELQRLDMDVESSSRFTVNGDGSCRWLEPQTRRQTQLWWLGVVAAPLAC